jgi:hypothetical protein
LSCVERKHKDGFSFTCYVGDSAVLLAFNLDEDKIGNLAGFAVRCKAPHTETYPTDEYWLRNRLSFDRALTAKETLTPEKWTESNKAPFQAFHWVHFPNAGPGNYTYTASPVYFEKNGDLKLVEGLKLDVDLNYKIFPELAVGFTRGYISSQAYADKFGNAPIEPKEKSMDFDTKEYVEKYEWLGAHARRILFDLLKESKEDDSISLDVFAYDFNEPDIIKELCTMGSRIRVFMDDSSQHAKRGALELQTQKTLKDAGAKVKTGKFGRYAHNKVIIQKKNGAPVKVLTGSANFSVRGLYVQANSVLLFESPEIAEFYHAAFEQAFKDPEGFKKSEIASRWHGAKIGQGSPVSISFAPHTSTFSLDRVAEAIESCRSSLMFAMMQMTGKGPTMDTLKGIAEKEGLYSLGTIEKRGQLELFKSGTKGKLPVTSFAYLKKDAPKPFQNEISGGRGQVIHHKFVVCDFNGKAPVAFCGSSNFAEGGEKSNGDNLIAIQGSDVATYYAIEAIRLYDHYRFRTKHEESTSRRPLTLESNDKWVKRYYDSEDMKFKERELLSMQ